MRTSKIVERTIRMTFSELLNEWHGMKAAGEPDVPSYDPVGYAEDRRAMWLRNLGRVEQGMNSIIGLSSYDYPVTFEVEVWE